MKADPINQISVPSIARHPVVHRSIVWAGTSVVNRPMQSFQDRRHKAAPCDKMLFFILLAVRAQQALLMPQHQDGFDHVRADSASRSSLQYRGQELRFCASGTQSERGQYVGLCHAIPTFLQFISATPFANTWPPSLSNFRVCLQAPLEKGHRTDVVVSFVMFRSLLS